MKIYSECTSQDFKTDISQLCEQCPLPEKFRKGLIEQIRIPTNEYKELYSNEQFNDYLHKEIAKAQKHMEDVRFQDLENKNNLDDPNRKNRISIYIWNKEKIKIFNEYLKELNSKETPALNQIEFALMRVYEGLPFEYDNYEGINDLYQNKDSIKKLKEHYKEFDNVRARQRDHNTITKLKNWIKKIEKVKPHLTDGKDQAERDLTVLYQHLEKFESK